MSETRLAVICGLSPAAGASAVAAALAVHVAVEHGRPALAVDAGPAARRLRSTLLSAPVAAELEAGLSGRGVDAAARGNVCRVVVPGGDSSALPSALTEIREVAGPDAFIAAHAPGAGWRQALSSGREEPVLAVLCAGRGVPAGLAALTVAEARARGRTVAVWTRPISRVAERRSLAGLPARGWGPHLGSLLDRADRRAGAFR